EEKDRHGTLRSTPGVYVTHATVVTPDHRRRRAASAVRNSGAQPTGTRDPPPHPSSPGSSEGAALAESARARRTAERDSRASPASNTRTRLGTSRRRDPKPRTRVAHLR